jgi:uncharacterized membrane-anchored protein YitT (DUF2179 family)
MIVTDRPATLEEAIGQTLRRGTTKWYSENGIHHQAHGVLFVTVSRPEARQLTEIVSAIDSEAFVVISQGQSAFGRGFKPMRR